MILKTARLTLRKFRAGDGPDLFAYLHQPRASCFLSMAVADIAAAEAEALKRAVDDDHIAICRSDTGRLIGDLFAVFEGDTVSIGWHLNVDHSGAGYAFEAASALFEELFSSGKARRIYAYVEDHNIRSQRLCERLGMRCEGRFLEFVSFTNDAAGRPLFENTMQYAILHREWQARSILL
ncbi:GNAT family N-acetyltransferase [Sphingomonas sp. TDK1]|uniref:GNAT family N-acetyltransferase n=1 Tax=Sphingomonas sp. TDK1 TaxID=453247 RepID=UPI0007D944E4|nr:GNAT family protein [Sphingomonas sp. TDK1]OAN66605.1 GCN5 family acetyltransferase [Sphingomonas sp. TDK1]